MIHSRGPAASANRPSAATWDYRARSTPPVHGSRSDGIREKLRLIVQTSLMGPAAIGLNEQRRLVRAGLVSSPLIGLTFVRYLWKIEPVASMSDAEVVAAIAPTLQRLKYRLARTAERLSDAH